MQETQRTKFSLVCALTIFLSAFLLFQVQPVISKMILPWFGGSPAVWTTAVLFFQTLLLAGYAYAHLVTHLGRPAVVAGIHATLGLLALATLPITPGEAWKPSDGDQPVARILILLGAHVGLTYFLLAGTSPLVQAWFAHTLPGRSPYRLYALSNVGSLGALLTYPIFVEPALETPTQGWVWSAGFLGFVVCCGVLTTMLWRWRPDSRLANARKTEEQVEAPVSFARRLIWVALPVIASMMLLVVTHHLSQDVAVAPFLWIAPLSLYLLTFIIAFERDRWYSRRWCGVVTAVLVVIISALMRGNEIDAFYGAALGIEFSYFQGAKNNAVVMSLLFLAMLFFLCMICHGETARARPAPRRLTGFYLAIAAGGALGGALEAVVFPAVFSSFVELHFGLAAAFALGLTVLFLDGRATWMKVDPKSDQGQLNRLIKVLGFAAAACGTIVVLWAQRAGVQAGATAMDRNFYGVLAVWEMFEDEKEFHGMALYHGRIMHGYQLVDPARRNTPTTYFHKDSGVGVAIRSFPRRPMRVGVIGLGGGTIAGFAESGDYYRFYEINPLVIEYCDRYFTFIEDRRRNDVEVDIIFGDARVSLEGEENQRFDVLVIDAFSGDAIPSHLLTQEALAVYERHLAEEGVLAFHISNRYLDLKPVVLALADLGAYQARQVQSYPPPESRLTYAPSDWVLLTKNEQALRHELMKSASTDLRKEVDQGLLWTDHFSNLLEILR